MAVLTPQQIPASDVGRMPIHPSLAQHHSSTTKHLATASELSRPSWENESHPGKMSCRLGIQSRRLRRGTWRRLAHPYHPKEVVVVAFVVPIGMLSGIHASLHRLPRTPPRDQTSGEPRAPNVKASPNCIGLLIAGPDPHRVEKSLAYPPESSANIASPSQDLETAIGTNVGFRCLDRPPNAIHLDKLALGRPRSLYNSIIPSNLPSDDSPTLSSAIYPLVLTAVALQFRDSRPHSFSQPVCLLLRPPAPPVDTEPPTAHPQPSIDSNDFLPLPPLIVPRSTQAAREWNCPVS
ncbi:hypothetical protein B2J93_2597 [Marssonina coronariae]|uniref:Uncharacterized protein n=1 Tax=Diplocarpon coronariae TaxID=2795749 RepID=A0A218YV33_9HELO|nr:hypothetical protein B2J93_2597 [Marssonina coronariae]